MSTTTPTATDDFITETYFDVVNLLRDCVHKFLRRHGTQYGDYDELFCLANHEFMTAYIDYKPNRGATFSTWCRMVITKGLLEHCRVIIRHDKSRRITPVDMTEDPYGSAYSAFDIVAFLDGLSCDAALLVQLVLNPTHSQARVFAREGRTDNATRKAIRHYLLGFGWDEPRINEAWQEVTQALDC